MENIFRAQTPGVAYLAHRREGIIHLEPQTKYGVYPKDISKYLYQASGCGMIGLVAHPDGWYPILSWLDQVMGVFIPLLTLKYRQLAFLEISIQQSLFKDEILTLESPAQFLAIPGDQLWIAYS